MARRAQQSARAKAAHAEAVRRGELERAKAARTEAEARAQQSARAKAAHEEAERARRRAGAAEAARARDEAAALDQAIAEASSCSSELTGQAEPVCPPAPIKGARPDGPLLPMLRAVLAEMGASYEAAKLLQPPDLEERVVARVGRKRAEAEEAKAAAARAAERDTPEARARAARIEAAEEARWQRQLSKRIRRIACGLVRAIHRPASAWELPRLGGAFEYSSGLQTVDKAEGSLLERDQRALRRARVGRPAAENASQQSPGGHTPGLDLRRRAEESVIEQWQFAVAHQVALIHDRADRCPEGHNPHGDAFPEDLRAYVRKDIWLPGGREGE